jgi:hypothetical protein
MKNPLQFFDPKTGEIMKNSLGYSQVISTLTAVGRKVSEQKFFEISPADYVPIVLGNGAYKRSIINWRTFVKGEGFEAGIISNASNNSQLSRADAAYDMISQNVISWATCISYNLFELQEALQANTLFSLIEARALARKKTWDLGIQKTAFMGVAGETGLLNNANIANDASTISDKISHFSAANFNVFVGAIWEAYRANCVRSARADRFVIPESDWNGLINFPDATYPLKTRLQLLEEAFKTISQNQNFKILPCAYCDKENYDTTNNKYMLLNYDESSIKMDIPIDYVQTTAGTTNGFTWENVAYGSFTGVVAQRPLEALYFSNTSS